jgi:hypothetical protein
VRFNMFWILYLLYSVLWLSVVGPIMMKHATGSKLSVQFTIYFPHYAGLNIVSRTSLS